MTNSKNTTAPKLARYAEVEASPVIQAYCDWIEQETGRRPDAWSVYVGSQLRGTFQKTPANQSRLAAEAKARAARDAAKAVRKAEREAKAAEKATPVPAPKPAPKRAPRKVATKPQTNTEETQA